MNLDLSYNNRLQTTLYDLKTQTGTRIMGREYQYTTTPTDTDNDGSVKYSRDLVSNNLDRTYTYDHVGHLQSAKAGVSNGSYYSGPFEQTYSYDVWSNLTGRSSRTFGHYGGYTYPQWNGYSENYVNNRNTTAGWQYDANGSLLTSASGGLTRQYAYDAAGMLLTSSETGKNITQAFDGNGQRVKFVENGTTTYYVRSSALGGQTLSEVNQYGAKVRGYVYAGAEVIAKQEGSQVLWDQQDVSGVSMRLTNSSGAVTSKVETDPLGTQVDDTANYNYSGGGSGGFSPAGFYGTPTDQNTGCSIGGMSMSCNYAMHLVEAGGYDRREVTVGNPWSLQNMFAQMGNPLIAINGHTEYYVRNQGQQNGAVTYGDAGIGSLQNISLNLHDNYLASFGYFWIRGRNTDGGSSPGRFLSHAQQNPQNPNSATNATSGTQKTNPCAGKAYEDLDYNTPYPRGKKKPMESGIEHITRRHILLDNGGFYRVNDPRVFVALPQRESKYVFSSSVLSVAEAQAFVIAANKMIFEEAQTNKTFKRDLATGNYYYYHNFGAAFNPFTNTVASGLGVQRYTSTLTSVGTLVVDKNCSRVVTSFPGTPSM